MKVVAPVGACLLAVSLVLDGQKHIEVRTDRGAPQPSNPFTIVSTATAQVIYPTAASYLSRIPL